MPDMNNTPFELRHCKTKISTSQQRAILALLVEPSVAAAAVKAKVGERTLHRWMRLEHFTQEYRFARREAFCQAIALTQRSSAAAVATLLRIMHDTNATSSARVTAATNILKFARESIELDDLAERIEHLRCSRRRTSHEQPIYVPRQANGTPDYLARYMQRVRRAQTAQGDYGA